MAKQLEKRNQMDRVVRFYHQVIRSVRHWWNGAYRGPTPVRDLTPEDVDQLDVFLEDNK